MDIETYKRQREQRLNEAPKFRELCVKCMQPSFGCYCEHIKTFYPNLKFVILIHPIEVKRRIATGRMAHQILEQSELIMGQDYSNHAAVNAILENPKFQPVVLYPGRFSQNISHYSHEQSGSLFSLERTPVIFVIDGTWNTARKTMHVSQNLKRLPRICFTPPGLSQFRVRKQPGVDCYSTIEAIHHTIELVGPNRGFDLAAGSHHNLLHVFNVMVERQLQFIREASQNLRSVTYRRIKPRVAC